MRTHSLYSKLLLGETVVELETSVFKRYVYAGGTKFAELTKWTDFSGGLPGVTYDSVQYYHNDANGVSQRVTRNYPEALLGQPSYNPNYIDPRQNEYDTFGTNVGLVSQQLQQPSAPADPPIPYDGDAYVYIDGIKGKIYLDGLPLSGQHAAAYINTVTVGGYMGITQKLMRQNDWRLSHFSVNDRRGNEIYNGTSWPDARSKAWGAESFVTAHLYAKNISMAGISWDVRGPRDFKTIPTRQRLLGSADRLRDNLSKLMDNETCRNFINALISNLKDTIVNRQTVQPLTDTILERFDSINENGGFWRDDTPRARAVYASGTITFNNGDFNLYNNRQRTVAIDGINRTNVSTLSSGVSSSNYRTYSVSGAKDTTFMLVHELIHSYYGLGHVVPHERMRDLAAQALQNAGIDSEPFSQLKNPSDYFNMALMEACSEVEL